jgi:hypothetical protein
MLQFKDPLRQRITEAFTCTCRRTAVATRTK